MELKSLRPIDKTELQHVGERWLTDTAVRRTRQPGPTSIKSVNYIAMKWFDFLGILLKSERHVDIVVIPFLRFLTEKRGLSRLTIQGCRSKITLFLLCCADRDLVLCSISSQHIEDFFEFKRLSGCKASTIAGFSFTLRTFFLYAEKERLTGRNLSKTILHPRTPRVERAPK
jgi:hypothetical protein